MNKYIDTTKIKTCSKCGEEKVITDFVYSQKKGYFLSKCKACELSRSRARVQTKRTPEQNRGHELIKRARKLADSLGFNVLKNMRNAKSMTTSDDYAGFMIVTKETNLIQAGYKFDMTVDDVLGFCSEVVAARSLQ